MDLDPAPEIVECLVRSGQTERAEVIGGEYARRAAAKGRPWPLARAARIQGLLADEAELDATGAKVARPGDTPRSRLTPRELQIAVALADGNTTREAASALFLSPKTVEYHLRNIYLKLGISSRGELAAQLRL